jgi:transglutaminase-like putative cysteine protease
MSHRQSPKTAIPAEYLSPGIYVNSDHPDVIAFANKVAHAAASDTEKAVRLYYAVRDGWRYDPYLLDLSPEAMKASALLQRDYGYCIEKAALLAAAARVCGIPSRLGFANVRNHIATGKLEALLETNLLVFHGYTELWLNNRWVKLTPAFNKSLCEYLGVAPLEFDGSNDALFQQYTTDDQQFMEYLYDYGTFPDIPREMFIAELHKHYPNLHKLIDAATNSPLKITGLDQ